MKNINSFNTEGIIQINNQKFKYFDLNKAAKYFNIDLSKTPISIKIIIENLKTIVYALLIAVLIRSIY